MAEEGEVSGGRHDTMRTVNIAKRSQSITSYEGINFLIDRKVFSRMSPEIMPSC